MDLTSKDVYSPSGKMHRLKNVCTIRIPIYFRISGYFRYVCWEFRKKKIYKKQHKFCVTTWIIQYYVSYVKAGNLTRIQLE